MKSILSLAAAAAGTAVLGVAAATTALPTHMHVSRSAVVQGSPEAVTSLVATYPNRLAWVPWTEIDPEAAYTFSGEPGTPGSTMSWVGDEIGTATLELQRVDPGRVGILFQTEALFGIVSAAILTTEPFGWKEAVGSVLVVSSALTEVFVNRPLAGRRARAP